MEIKRVTEKVRISNLCSNGFYQFESSALYKNIFSQLYNKNTSDELFIAPMYNTLIQNNYALKYRLVSKSEHKFYGTPEEYFVTIEKEND
jgi:dTDP-glucose pyrophosphorylase